MGGKTETMWEAAGESTGKTGLGVPSSRTTQPPSVEKPPAHEGVKIEARQ